MPVNSNCQTYCGQGALQVSAAFFQSDAGPGGAGSSGQILLPLVPANAPPGTGQNLTGATITIHLRAVPPDPSGMLNFHLVLLTTSAGSQNAGMTATFTSDQWIAVATPPLALATGDGGADAGNGIRGIDSVYQLSLEFFSFQNYQGKIYVDEVDIQP
jgi:hypothetical protein